jgi:hypothetical protein
MQETWNIRNYSSMGAIMKALQCKKVACLTLTHDHVSFLARRKYEKMVKLLKRDPDYNNYRKDLRKKPNDACIPWQGVRLFTELGF